MTIQGVITRDLETHEDDRGFFREIMRQDKTIQTGLVQQISHSFVNPGVIKAWHLHNKQIDWWYVVAGHLKIALYDLREGPTKNALQSFEMTSGTTLMIPPGVAHGYKALIDTDILYLASEFYDPDDTIKIPRCEIKFEWQS